MSVAKWERVPGHALYQDKSGKKMCMKYSQFLNVNNSAFQTFHAKHIACTVFTSTQSHLYSKRGKKTPPPQNSIYISYLPHPPQVFSPCFLVVVIISTLALRASYSPLTPMDGHVFKLCIGYNNITSFA